VTGLVEIDDTNPPEYVNVNCRPDAASVTDSSDDEFHTKFNALASASVTLVKRPSERNVDTMPSVSFNVQPVVPVFTNRFV